MNIVTLTTPLQEKDVTQVSIGDRVLLNGTVYTARDEAHRRLIILLKEGRDLPLPINGQVIYYVGPTPPKPGHVIGSAGPTTSSRMDPYTPLLIQMGLRATIGKGCRSQEVINAMIKYKAVYLAAAGGAGAFLSRFIKKAEILAFEDLGPEAIYALELMDFPTIVVNDTEGRDLYQEAIKTRQTIPESS
jgi:fumarate hydratase subunit beta